MSRAQMATTLTYKRFMCLGNSFYYLEKRRFTARRGRLGAHSRKVLSAKKVLAGSDVTPGRVQIQKNFYHFRLFEAAFL